MDGTIRAWENMEVGIGNHKEGVMNRITRYVRETSKSKAEQSDDIMMVYGAWSTEQST